MSDDLISKARFFCDKNNIFYEKGIEKTIEQVVAFNLSEKKDIDLKMRTFDYFKEIDQITATIDGHVLTFHVSRKNKPHEFLKPPVHQTICDACHQFFEFVVEGVNRLPNATKKNLVVIKHHKGILSINYNYAFSNSPIYFELMEVKSLF